MSTELDEVAELLRANESAKAQALLARILQKDLRNAEAWFLLAQCVTDPEQRRQCLTRVVALDPQHELAQALLEHIQPQPEPTAEALPISTPAQAKSFEPQAFKAVKAQSAPSESFQPHAFDLTGEPNSANSADSFTPQPFALADVVVLQPETSSSALPPWLRTPTEPI